MIEITNKLFFPLFFTSFSPIYIFVLHYFVGSFSAMRDFLTLFLEDSRTWTVEYPRGRHGTLPPILLEHQGESGKFMGKGGRGRGRADKERIERAALLTGNFLQHGRSLGVSGAVNYLRYVHILCSSVFNACLYWAQLRKIRCFKI